MAPESWLETLSTLQGYKILFSPVFLYDFKVYLLNF